MTIQWLEDRHPGDIGERFKTDLAPAIGPGAMLVHNNIPDVVRRPDTGETLRVLKAGRLKMACPMCKVEGESDALALEQDITVYDCPHCRQFIWFRFSCKEGS